MYIPSYTSFVGFNSNNEGILFRDNTFCKYNFDTKTFSWVYTMNVLNCGFPSTLNKIVVIRDNYTSDIFNLITMKLEKTVIHSRENGKLNQVAMSEDCKLVAYGFDFAIEIRDAVTNELYNTFYTLCNMKILFSPMGNMLLNFLSGRGIETYKVYTGEKLSSINIKINNIWINIAL